MLSNLFQDSDYVLYMGSDLDKRPYGAFLSKANVPPLFAAPYFAINPIDQLTNRNERGDKTLRAAMNVTAFRNFLFEIDSLDIYEQEPLVRYLHSKLPFAQVTYSGGSSLHAIVSVADTLPFQPHTEDGIALYKQAWRALNTYLTELASAHLGEDCPGRVFDPSCKDPCRLSRTPNAMRPDTDRLQAELEGFGGLVSSDQILGLMQRYNLDSISVAPPSVGYDATLDTENFKKLLRTPQLGTLRRKLENPELWAGPENMYPVLFQYTLWVIDATGAPLSTTLAYMHERVFPTLHSVGYPRNPEIAIYNAYIWKGLA